MKYYAGIGSRETPEHVLDRMTKLAGILERKGFILRSGSARGADRAFERGVKDQICNVEIFLVSNDTPLWTHTFTEHFHPQPKALGEHRGLMDRNACQILGRDGNTPVEFVVCWTKDGKASGGTGHALRIAKYYDIPIYNFYCEADIENLKERLRGG